MKFASIALIASFAMPVAATGRAQDTTPTKPAKPYQDSFPANAKPAPKPYQDSFPVSATPAAHGSTGPHSTTSTAPAASTGGLRLLPSTRPSAPSGATGSAGATHAAATAGTGAVKPATTSHATGVAGSTGRTGSASGTTATTATPKPPSASSATAAAPQGPVYGVFNRGVVLLDPAHGGVDTGSRLTDALNEKDVTLALAFKLRSLLQARGFTVVLTRDSDAANEPDNPGTPLTLDDRAGLANHQRPVACLLLHATAAGTGVHLYRSELAPTNEEPLMANWLTAQAPWVNASAALSDKLADALSRSNIPRVASAASVRPVDSMTCPALVVELAPQDTGDADTENDAGYQNKVAEAIATELVFWRNQAKPPQKAVPPPPATTVTGTSASGSVSGGMR